LSSKQRKGEASKKSEPANAPRVAPVRPAGRAPEAIVASRHGTGVVTRLGRGFSMGELSGAGLSPRLASNWGARLDIRRRSVIQGNVDALRSWGAHETRTLKVDGRVKGLEEELEKVGREVKKEAVKAEKEVAKVEKEVKEEAEKAKKAVKRKAAKPKTKAKKSES